MLADFSPRGFQCMDAIHAFEGRRHPHPPSRVLRPTGRLLIGVIPEDSPWGEHYLRKKAGGHPFYHAARFFTADRLKRLLHAVGLRPVALSSTLVQSRPGTPRPEQARSELVPGAGFVCVLVPSSRGRADKGIGEVLTELATNLRTRYNSPTKEPNE